MPYLQIYKNRSNAIYTHSVLKGDDLYEVNVAAGEKMRWRYIGKVDPKIYQVSGTLLRKPSLKMITILQRVLQPPVKESFVTFKDWLKESVNFERGVDPKISMNIGMMKDIQDLVKEIQEEYQRVWYSHKPEKAKEIEVTGKEWYTVISHMIRSEKRKFGLPYIKYVIEKNKDKNLQEEYSTWAGKTVNAFLIGEAEKAQRLDVLEYFNSLPQFDFSKAPGVNTLCGSWTNVNKAMKTFMWLYENPKVNPANKSGLFSAANGGMVPAVVVLMGDSRITSGHEEILRPVAAWGGYGGPGDGMNAYHFNPELLTWLLYHPKIWPKINDYRRKRYIEAIEVGRKHKDNIEGAKEGRWFKGFTYPKYSLDHINPKYLKEAREQISRILTKP